MSQGDQILAIPTVVRRLPPPMKKVIENLPNAKKALLGLELRQSAACCTDAPQDMHGGMAQGKGAYAEITALRTP